jgi:hypothetical protein
LQRRIRRFNPIAEVAEKFLVSFDKVLYERKGSPFLGIGGTGCVFLVHNWEGTRQLRNAQAMKVVTGASNIPLLKAEFMMNTQISQFADVIIRASDIKYQLDGAGMLMSDVGTEIELNQLRNLKRRGALDSLWRLHKAGFYHGDARKQNLLECGGDYKWCDLQHAGSLAILPDEMQVQDHLMHDIRTLLSSFS